MVDTIKAKFGTEVSFNTSTGNSTYLPFSATLAQNAAILIFDNQSNVAVIISDNGTTAGKTFAAGESMVLDLRTNKQLHSDDFTWAIGTQFYANCAAGAGSFYISTVYAA